MLKSSKYPALSQIKKQHPLDDDDHHHHHQMKKEQLFSTTCSSRVVSKETSTGNPSFRVLYYGGVSGAVPFTWETQPGTPKHKFFSDRSTPPTLTPPPSYYSTGPREKQPIKKSSKLLNNIFFHLKKSQLPLSSPSSSSSSSYSSSKSVPASHRKIKLHRRRRLLSIGSSFDHDNDPIDHDYQVSTTNHKRSNSSSMLCFGGRIRF